MIFASDLDQTLIYSNNFLNNNYSNSESIIDKRLSIIEYFEGEPLSYIDNEVLMGLQELDKNDCFVPVTTRTQKQYHRLDFDLYDINPQYAITTNGAIVLKDGVIDKYWQDKMKHQLSLMSLQVLEIKAIVESMLLSEMLKKNRIAEGIFLYCVLNKSKLNLHQIKQISEKLKPEGWIVSLQGNKLYFMPEVISKWNALDYISTQTDESNIITAGDSLLDLSMLKQTEIGLVPGHGEIFDRDLHTKYNLDYCGEEGLEASVAITREVLKNLD